MVEEFVPNWYTFDGNEFSRDSFVHVWLLALSTDGVGDVVTTIALLWFSPYHVEANPVVAGAITPFGGGGYLGLKLLSFFGCLGVSVWAGVRGRNRCFLRTTTHSHRGGDHGHGWESLVAVHVE